MYDNQPLIAALKLANTVVTDDIIVRDIAALRHHAASVRELEVIRKQTGRLVDMRLEMFNNCVSWCDEILGRYGCQISINSDHTIDIVTRPLVEGSIGVLVFEKLV